MAHKTYKNAQIKIDSSAGALVEVTSSTNSHSLQSALNLIEDSAYGDSDRTYLPGLHGATFDLNGYINSTTSALFQPLINTRTSITKTVAVYDGVRWQTGEAWPVSPNISGSLDNLMVWSCGFTIEGALTSTSVAPS